MSSVLPDSLFTIVGGSIIDGTGAPRYPGKVVVEDDRIVAVGPDVPTRGIAIDCTGQVVCPGFIDMHSHSDLVCMSDPQLTAKVRQGITTEVLGQDGLSEAPIPPEYIAMWRRHLSGLNGDPDLPWDWRSFGDYLDRCGGAAINMTALVGHGPIRLHAVGMENRPVNTAELDLMSHVLDEALAEGAVGFSTGLIYSPCVYGDTDELIALGRVVARHGAFMVYHMRYEGQRVLDGMEEVFRIARESGAACHISHFKARGRQAWGKAAAMVEAVERAQAEGLDITADQYPYLAGSTMLGALLPPWCHAEGTEGLKAFLRDPALRERIESEIVEGRADWESTIVAVGWENIVISGVATEQNMGLVGTSLPEIAESWKRTSYEAMVRLLLEEDLDVSMIIHALVEEDLKTLMRQPWVMTCTDGLMGGEPHPRTYGTFPRKLGHYVREEGLEPLEEAVRKMTSLPAQRLGFADRGVLRADACADIVVFDPDVIIDRATYEMPRTYPEGILHVFVNGSPAVWNAVETGRLAGRSIRA
ncbi:MAG: D-aminoacylase [Chloroflexia bacterium]|nr:D-aminoacylase [Chloroflexia bacterium]